MNVLKDILLPIGLMLLSASVAFLGTKYWSRKKQEQDLADKRLASDEKMRERITELERQLAVIGSTVEPISTAFQALLIKQLTHFHTPELDALLVKLGPPYTLTADEELRLATLLEQRTRDMGEQIDDSERDAAKMLPMIIKRVRAESALAALDLKVVAVPQDQEKKK